MLKCNQKRLACLLSAVLMIFLLSACGTSLQKPTGLEEAEFEQEERMDEDPLGETQEPSEEEATDTPEEEPADQSVNPQVEQDKTTPTVKTDQNEQGKDKIKPSEKPESKLAESSSTGNKQPSQPVANNKKPSTPSSAPAVPTKTPSAEKHAEKVEQPETQANTITYSIVISSTEVPLPVLEMDITDGDTVLKALIDIAKEKKIQMDYRGGQGATAYIEGIDNVYEFDRGQGSGWMYRVNGIFPDRGAGVVPLRAGDVVEWIYTTDLGVDIGAELKPFRR